MGYKVFTPTVLTSTDINSYLMKQTVMVFADATARGLALTAPAAGMVTYLTGTNALNTYNGSSWVVTGVTSAVAGTGVGVSAATGAVTFSIGQSVATSVKPTFAGINSTGPIDITTAPHPTLGINVGLIIKESSAGYPPRINFYDKLGTTFWAAIYSPSVGIIEMPYQVQITTANITTMNCNSAAVTTNLTAGGYIAAGGTGLTDAGSVSANGWFRATGNTGLYFQSWGGGFNMTDSTWVRTYNSKNLYTNGETRTNGSFSSDQSRQRGSYGDITVGSNGRQGGWGGIEFVSPEDQTFMVYTDQHSGMYRNNTTWNWLWNYSTLQVPSDERYKREIEPLGLGMKFIEQLNPVSFLRVTEREDDDPDATEEGYYYGFTAQNVRDALDVCGETRDVKIHDIGGPNMGLVACVEGAVYDRQFIGISEFIAPVVEAIKELNVRLKTLEGV